MNNSQVTLSAKSVTRLNQWKRGIQSEYEPFLTVRKVNKVGRRHWVYCPVQNREVHLLSDGELRAYKILLSMPETCAVREQYALDIDDTMVIAAELGYLHPRNYKTREATVMTTDFVVDRKVVGKMQRVAYTFKYTSQMFEDENGSTPGPKFWRTFQKFEIERQYWARRGVKYRIITEKHATKEHFWNLRFCEDCRDMEVDDGLLGIFIDALYSQWDRCRTKQLQVLCTELGRLIGISATQAMRLFKFGVYHSYILISQDSHLRPFRPVQLLPFE
ncbi:hypothetical protein GMES_0836 [Paraglaciecola mesophila KMM 241]|uniref:TnsA endonuclease N-terminal domain-containing protein n=2 Tax=Paraglaciecola mesophila TaxID=197222 RepID=K6YGM4_9ALTE|nr:hypothetical protein GMES_0836 [Paraglaciecola mesophila KMM 241]